MNNKKLARGFTLVEVTVVMIIIGILATVTYIAYIGLQAKARDVSVQSDIDHMESIQTSYGVKHNTAGKAYYSINGPDSDLAFSPSDGNVIQVVVSSTDYCIRGYNPNGTKNSITNAATKESAVGICATLNATDLPPVPGLTVAQASGVVTATIIPVNCSGAGAAQYGIRSRTDSGTWTDYSSWSALLTSSQTANYGVTYDYQVQTRCYSDANLISGSVLTPVVSYTHNPLPPSAPDVAVNLNGSNVQATVTSSDSCSVGNEEYAFDYYTNAGSWVGFSSWSSSKNITQAPAQGVQYTYRAKAHCTINGSVSTDAVGSAGTPYVAAINTPSAPTISWNVNDWMYTTWSWSSTSCPSGTTANYQTSYFYDNNPTPQYPIYTITTATSSQRQTSRWQTGFYMRVQAQCQNSYTASAWSSWGIANNSSEWFRRDPYMQVMVVGGGGGGGFDNGGGGGGGGFIEDDYYYSTLAMQQTTDYWVQVGGGGGPQANGGNSSFMSYTAIGGGRGANCCGVGGATGGSGGGGSGTGSGNSDYGYNYQPSGYSNIGGRGGNRNGSSCGKSGTYYAGGGGGGAADRGGDAWSGGGGPSQMQGGAGRYTGINGGTYAAGGGGGGDQCYWGSGGSGGGGNGAAGSGATGGNASNYGSGGGGGSGRSGQGGYGYQGLVMIRYPLLGNSGMYADEYYWNGSAYYGVGQSWDGYNYTQVFTNSGKISFRGYF